MALTCQHTSAKCALNAQCFIFTLTVLLKTPLSDGEPSLAAWALTGLGVRPSTGMGRVSTGLLPSPLGRCPRDDAGRCLTACILSCLLAFLNTLLQRGLDGGAVEATDFCR